MANKEVWFQRGDGVKFSAEEGSASYQLMKKDGSFTELDADGYTVEPSIVEQPAEKPLARMNKTELYAEAAKRDVPVTEEMTKAQSIAAIETKAAAAEAETDKDPEGAAAE